MKRKPTTDRGNAASGATEGGVVPDEGAAADSPRCLKCGHEFGAGEIAGMSVRQNQDDLSVVDCACCGAHNEVKAQPSRGLGTQPVLIVRRVVRKLAPLRRMFRYTA